MGQQDIMGTALVTASESERVDGKQEQFTLVDNGEIQEDVEAPNASQLGSKVSVVKYGEQETAEICRFHFLRVEVFLEMPSDPDKINETFEFCRDWVRERRKEEVKTGLRELQR